MTSATYSLTIQTDSGLVKTHTGSFTPLQYSLVLAALRDQNHSVQRIIADRDTLADAIRRTIEENRHLADGDVCTLRGLIDALAILEKPPTKSPSVHGAEPTPEVPNEQ